MTFWRLVFRSLRFYTRSQAGVLAGAAIASAVLIGALILGDCVRMSLRHIALARLGSIHFALASPDRFFRPALADELAQDLKLPAAPVLQLPGVAVRSETQVRANRVQVFGIDSRFWQLSSSAPPLGGLDENSVLINDRLAAQLEARVGDALLLRVPKPSLLSRDAPLSPQEDTSVALRLTVRAILGRDQFGHFSLQANQMPPYNAFVSLARLHKDLALTNQANLLVVGNNDLQPININPLTAALRQRWQLADGQLELRTLTNLNLVELRSPRVFLDEAAGRAARGLSTNTQGILTYFVNEIRLGSNAAPYSIVSALQAPFLPAGLGDDEIVINQWLAEDLSAKRGDVVELKYFVVGALRKLEERWERFQVRAILPLAGAVADRQLMPDFPGLAAADNCRDWDAGFPINLERIRAKDQKYWDDHRGTPKAFLTLAAGQRIWSSRFGDLTAVRFPSPEFTAEKLTQRLRGQLDPAAFGLVFQPVRETALKASAEAQDFGQLFLGFSFFLIFSALLLMVMLFQFGIEQRATEMGALLAMGFTPRRVFALLLAEGGLVALAGSLLGAGGGWIYAQALLRGLVTVWRGAVGTPALDFYATPATLAYGWLASLAAAVLAMTLALRKQGRRTAIQLLATGSELETALVPGRRGRSRWKILLSVLAGLGGLGSIGYGLMRGGSSPGAFFAAGALLLLAGFGLASSALAWLASDAPAGPIRLGALALRNLIRRPRRSLATLMLLACGSFLIIAVGANRLDARREAGQRQSGTGGFAWIAESALPVVQDLNRPEGRAFYGLELDATNRVQIVAMRVRDGDEASCLNLNRAQTPRLLGVESKRLQGRFVFARMIGGPKTVDPWELLDQDLPEGVVPAMADQASILWAMGKKVGDVLLYQDERGQTFKVRLVAGLANSILQGSLLISESAFIRHYPSESGYRMFLIDAPSNPAAVAAGLARALQDVGLEVTSAVQRLAAFNTVQNTYLSTFQVLGALGLLLGSAGLGVVLMRNVLERRGEMALLTAVGFRPGTLRGMLLREHGALLLAGLALGVVTALVAVLPALLAPGAEMPYGSLALTLAAVLACGMLWTWLATWLALRGDLLEAIKLNN